MPPNSHVKDYSFLCIQVIWGYLPRKPRLQNWSNFRLQVNRLIVELEKVKSMSSLVRLVSSFGWFESVESTCSKSSLVRIGLFVVVGWSPILDLGVVSIGCRSLVLAPVLIAPLCFQLRSSARSLVIVPSLSLVFWNVVLGVASSDNPQCSPWCQSSGLRVSSLLRAPGCDETVPQYVLSSRDRLGMGGLEPI